MGVGGRWGVVAGVGWGGGGEWSDERRGRMLVMGGEVKLER